MARKNHLTENCVVHNGDIFIKASPQLKLSFPHTGANNKRRLKKKEVWVFACNGEAEDESARA